MYSGIQLFSVKQQKIQIKEREKQIQPSISFAYSIV